MPFNHFQKIIDESEAKYIQLSGVNEPLLYPDIARIVKYAKSQKRFVKITTNGTVLNDHLIQALLTSGLDMLDISLDTTNPQIYREIRQTELTPVIKNVQKLYDLRNKIGAPLVIRAKHSYNEKNIYHLPQDIKKITHLPFDEALFMWISDIYVGSKESSIKREYLQVIERAITVAKTMKRRDLIRNLKILEEYIAMKEKNVSRKVCYEPVYAPYVTVDGDLTACCQSCMWILQSKEHLTEMKLGNIVKQPFSEVWNSVQARKIRRNVLEHRTTYSLCQHCIFDDNPILHGVYRVARSMVYRVRPKPDTNQ